MEEETKVADDTSIEDKADDSASPEADVQPEKDDADTSTDAPEDTQKDKTDELAKNYKIRAEKAEKELKKLQAQQSGKSDTKSSAAKPDDIKALVQQELAAARLAEMPYPADLKKELKRVADIKGVSLAEAQSDPYIKSKIDAWEKEKEAEDAALSRNNKTGGKGKFDPNSPPDFDLTTEKGRKEYDDWMDKAIKHEMATRGR